MLAAVHNVPEMHSEAQGGPLWRLEALEYPSMPQIASRSASPD